MLSPTYENSLISSTFWYNEYHIKVNLVKQKNRVNNYLFLASKIIVGSKKEHAVAFLPAKGNLRLIWKAKFTHTQITK